MRNELFKRTRVLFQNERREFSLRNLFQLFGNAILELFIYYVNTFFAFQFNNVLDFVSCFNYFVTRIDFIVLRCTILF